MERGRTLLILKVKGHISRSLGLYKEFWHLDPCGQDIARTIWPWMLKLSVYTLYGKRKKPIYYQGQGSNLKSLGLYRELWHLDPCGQDMARTMQSRFLKLIMHTSYGKKKKPIYFQGQRSNFKVTRPL